METTVWVMAMALAGMFVAVLALFFVQHTLIILNNKTQVEDAVSGPDNNGRTRWIFDVGRATNWRLVMGDHVWQWLLPVAYRCAPTHAHKRAHTRRTDV
jgi:hypothetical protein